MSLNGKSTNNFLFIHIPKCGGTSLIHAFDYEHPHFPDKSREHDSIRSYETSNYDYTFSIVRNPWDRAVSWFFYHKSESQKWMLEGLGRDWGSMYSFKTFQKWVHAGMPTHWRDREGEQDYPPTLSDADPVWEMKNHWLCDAHGNLVVKNVFKLEQLSKCQSTEWGIINENLGVSDFSEYPWHNKSDHRHYTEYYDESTRQAVAEICSSDIEFFGYSFGEDL